MAFKLSNKSLAKLEGIDPDLVAVVRRAIEITDVDFVVIEGLRTVERQRQLVARGASQTMKSKHIDGLAVDLAAYIGGQITWKPNVYDNIADAMKMAAYDIDVPICWGAAWHIPDIRGWDGSMQDATDSYVNLRRSQGKRPFLDYVHFQIGVIE